MEFFASLKAFMTSMRSVLPVNFCTSGSSSRMKTLNFFSSPIVNLPWVCLFELAKASSFLMGSDWMTLTPNLMLPLVYSWPG